MKKILFIILLMSAICSQAQNICDASISYQVIPAASDPSQLILQVTVSTLSPEYVELYFQGISSTGVSYGSKFIYNFPISWFQNCYCNQQIDLEARVYKYYPSTNFCSVHTQYYNSCLNQHGNPKHTKK